MMMRHAVLAGVALLAIGVVPHAAAAVPQVASSTLAPASASAPSPAAITARRDGIDVRQGALSMHVTALSDTILRVRVAPAGALPEDASWAVPADVRAHTISVTAAPDGFTTAAIRVRVDPAMRLVVEDLAGRVITADAAPVAIDGHAFSLRKRLDGGEHLFGLGDKTGGLDRRGGSFVDWNTDAFAFTSSTDPIYKSIPFFVSAGGAGGSYGVLLDNTWRAWFDLGHRDPDVAAFGAPDGPIDYYLIAGPTLPEVVRRYTDLTGKAPLPPQWALGFQQSRWSYMSAAEVRQIVDHLRQDRIPTDVVWLDIDYQDRNRPFTVDRTTFPDLAGLAGDLRKDGVRLVAITDLHIAKAPGQGYAPYDSGMEGHHFVRNPDGSTFVGPVWPGPSVFPDFTDAGARRWWGTLYRGLVGDGIAGFWNDMNEPAVFETPTKTMPLDTVHHIAGDDFAPRDARHAEVHNVYGMLNTRATYEGLRMLRPDERAFVMTRASYAGGQRYSVTWTGDNSATWDHLKLSVHQLVNLGLSGFAYGGADVGGFTGGPSPELMTRWFEIAAFTPVFRDHSVKGSPRAEPWVDGPEQLAIRRRYVEERYRLMPYLYALADRNARAGDPIMRPVFYDYPSALTATCDQSMAFTLGGALLVAPPPKPESPQAYDVCLPAGGWYDYWTGLPVTSASARPTAIISSAAQTVALAPATSDVVSETPRLDHLPVFVRAGTILPRQPLVQSTAQLPDGPLQLDVYPGADCSGVLYADDGHSMAFLRGGFLRQAMRCTVNGDRLHITFAKREGRYRPWWKHVVVQVHGWQGLGTVTTQGHVVASAVDAPSQVLRLTIADPHADEELVIAPS